MTSRLRRAFNPFGFGIGRVASTGILLGGLVAAGPRPALADEPPSVPLGVAPNPQAGPAPAEYAPAPTAPGYASPPQGVLPAPVPSYAPQAMAPGYASMEPHPGPALFGDARSRSPGLAVALSLQPLPVDIGNLYAENVGWGIAYTAIEVSLMTPMMWFVGQHMDHGYADNRSWSGAESGTMVGLVAAYVAVKLVAGLHAGYAAQTFNRAYEPGTTAFVVPARGGALLAWSRTF